MDDVNPQNCLLLIGRDKSEEDSHIHDSLDLVLRC